MACEKSVPISVHVHFSHWTEETQTCRSSPKGAGRRWNPRDPDTGNDSSVNRIVLCPTCRICSTLTLTWVEQTLISTISNLCLPNYFTPKWLLEKGPQWMLTQPFTHWAATSRNRQSVHSVVSSKLEIHTWHCVLAVFSFPLWKLLKCMKIKLDINTQMKEGKYSALFWTWPLWLTGTVKGKEVINVRQQLIHYNVIWYFSSI